MTSPPVVCNASPLIALEQIAHLPILKALFGTVLAHDFRVAPSLYAQVLRDAGEGG